MINPKLYLVRLKPGPKENPNLGYHRYFHSKSDMERWVKENETKVKDIHVARWEKHLGDMEDEE